MDHEWLRRLAQETSDEMNARLDQRMAEHAHDAHARLLARIRECEKRLGIEQQDGPARDGWDDYEFDQRVPPNITRIAPTRRDYGRR